MKYSKIVKGKFISRPNRFIANVEIDGKGEIVHVKNTGRCKELLVKGATVYLAESDNPQRKTKYDLVCVEKGDFLVNMDSQIVNDVAYEYLSRIFPCASIKREVRYKNSRFDFYIENGKDKIFVEAKGVTLENEGVVSFPDAPTERGVKHLSELISATKEGFLCYALFIVQMEGVKYFVPNDKTHKEFGDTLRLAKQEGVKLLCVDCKIYENEIIPHKEIEIRL